MQGATKRTLKTSIAEAATSTVQLPMLVALPDELLDVVVDLCREAVAFVCLVCRRLSESERRTRTTLERLCPVHEAFVNMETLNFALGQSAFSCVVMTKGLEWTRTAKDSAIRSGNREVVFSVCPNLCTDTGASMVHISRYDRMDILMDPLNSSILAWIDHHVSTLARRLTHRHSHSDSVKGIVSQILVPGLCGGSIDVLLWVFNNLRRRQLARDCVWNRLLSDKSSSTPALMAVAAFTAKEADAVLELVCELLAEASCREMKTVRRHVAAVGITMAKSSLSGTALRWAQKLAPSFNLLVDGVNEDIDKDVVIVPVQHVYIGVTRATFKPRSLSAYTFFKEETKAGGWIHDAFHSIHGYETSCIPWVVSSELMRSEFAMLDSRACREDSLALLVESIADCFDTSNRLLVPGQDTLVRRMVLLSQRSVFSAFRVLCSVLRPYRACGSVAGIPEPTKDVIYGGGGVIYTVLLHAVYDGLVGVVEKLLSFLSTTGGLGMGVETPTKHHDNIMKVACHCDSRSVTMALLKSGHFRPTGQMAEEAALRLKSNFLDSVLDFDHTLADERVASAAYQTRDAETVGVALSRECFTKGSLLESEAIRLVKGAQCSSHKKRRRLPASMSLGVLE